MDKLDSIIIEVINVVALFKNNFVLYYTVGVKNEI